MLLTDLELMKPNKVNISFKYDKNYSVSSPTDAYGNINPRGNLVMNLFSDMQKIPNQQISNLDDEGKIKKDEIPKIVFDDDKIKVKEDTLYMDRIIHNTIMLTPNSAIEIAFWMIDNVIKAPTTQVELNQLKEHFLNMIDSVEEEKNE